MDMSQCYRSLISVLTLVTFSHGDLHTAVDGLEKVLHAEVRVADELNIYIEHQEKQLEALRAVSEDYRRHGLQSLKDIKASLGNPVNAFLLMKRLTSDLNKLIPSTTVNELRKKIDVKIKTLPSDQDLVGAANALLRIQDTYELSSAQIAKGEIPGVKWPSSMTAEDCFEVGGIAFKQDDFYHAILWFEESLAMLEKERVKTLNRFKVIDHLAFSLYKKGNIEEAMRLTNDLLEIEPTNTRLEKNMATYMEKLHEESKVEDETVKNKNTRKLEGYHATEEFKTYEKLCRGERSNEDYPWHKLTCQFKRHHPFFYIRPLREETVYTDPWIVVYHDMLSDFDIRKIKKHAEPKLARSGLFISQYGHKQFESRTSQTAWLADEEHCSISSISKRVQAMTNMSMQTAEPLQVLNYGIGGHYEPHHDYAKGEEQSTFDKTIGNRIMTVIFYMTDVEAGGATVFPKLGVTLWPKKGSCAVWYNLKANGDGDNRTLHAGCPVMVGNKWVCNKWIHERGQEFVRPCTLNSDE